MVGVVVDCDHSLDLGKGQGFKVRNHNARKVPASQWTQPLQGHLTPWFELVSVSVCGCHYFETRQNDWPQLLQPGHFSLSATSEAKA